MSSHHLWGGRRVWASVLVLSGVAPVVLACVNLQLNSTTREDDPCTGSCDTGYVVCPVDETCPGGSSTGYDKCVSTTMTLPCAVYIGGTTADGYCCSGGAPSSPPIATNRTKAVVRMTPTGNCTWWAPVPDEN